MVWIPTIEYVESLFEDLIKIGELLNRQGLLSTLDKVKWGKPFLDIPSIWDQVTILYKEIIEFHYFSDGNKRISSLLAFIFLYKNGYEFSPPQGEILQTTLEVAQGLRTFDQIKIWFQSNSIKV